MKKAFLVVIALLLTLSSFAAYPNIFTNPWGQDTEYKYATNKSLNLLGSTDVKIYQWIAGNFFSRGYWGTQRGASINGASISNEILITKPGVLTSQFLGVVALMSNGAVDVDVKLNSTVNAVTGKTNIAPLVTALSAVQGGDVAGMKTAITTGLGVASSTMTITSDLKDALNPIKTTPTVTVGDKAIKVSNLFGNTTTNNTITGPEYGIFADLNVPVNQEPGKDFIIALDITISPRTIF